MFTGYLASITLFTRSPQGFGVRSFSSVFSCIALLLQRLKNEAKAPYSKALASSRTKCNERLLVLLLAFLTAVLWQSLLPAVAISGPEPVVAKPRSVVSLVFLVSNDSDTEQRYQLGLDLPDGWTSISSLRPLKLGPGATRRKLISIAIPQRASAAHPHLVRLTATRQDEPRDVSAAEVTVTVTPEFGLKLHVMQADNLAWTGETVVHRFDIQNMGNSVERFGISLRSSLNWTVIAPQETVNVKPGQRLPLTVRVEVPQGALQGERNYITLDIWPLNPAAPRDQHLKRHRMWVEAIPRCASDDQVYQSLPSTFELKAFDIAHRSLPKMRPRLRSAGILDERYLVDMDLSATTFREFDESANLERDFYRLDVADIDNWDVSVGDTRSEFSYLTRDVWGRGARVRTFRPTWESTWFFSQDDLRTDAGIEEQVIAGDVTLLKCDLHEIGVTHISIRETATDRAPEGALPQDLDLTTIHGHFHPCDELAVSAEAGRSHLEEPDEEHNDYAWWALATYDTGSWMLEGEAYRSGSYYIAKLQDRKGYRGYGAYRQGKSELWAEQHNYRSNIAGNPELTREETERSRLGCYLDEGEYVPSLDVFSEYRNELSFADDQFLDERTILLSATLHKNYTHSSVTGRGRWDFTKERTTGERTKFQQYEAYGKWHFAPWTVGMGSYFTFSSKVLEDVDNQRLEFWGSRPMGNWGTILGRATLTWRSMSGEGDTYAHRGEIGYYVSRDRWFVDIRARTNILVGGDLPSDRHQEATQLIGHGTYSIAAGHSIEAYVELNEPDSQDREIRSVLTWKKDFKLPVPLVRTKSVLKGQLVLKDAEALYDCPGRPLSKLRLSLDGCTVYTDSRGRFSFPAREPGTYILTMDDSHLPSQLAINADFPMQICLEKGEKRHLTLPVVAVASIKGQVFMDPEQRGTQNENSPGVGSIRIALYKGEQFLRETFTGGLGNYFFHNLTPGDYVLRLDTDYLPLRHHLTTEQELHFTVKPRQQIRDAHFGVYEKPRELKIRRFGN